MKLNLRSLLPLASLFCLLLAVPVRATTYTLNVIVQGSGSVTTNPVYAAYPSGVTVALTATPSTGWFFGGWSGAVTAATNQVNVTMTGNLSVTATFLPSPGYSLTLATNGHGAIFPNPFGASDYNYSNPVVSATAAPATGWVFTGCKLTERFPVPATSPRPSAGRERPNATSGSGGERPPGVGGYGFTTSLVNATRDLILAAAAASRNFTTLPHGAFSSALMASTSSGFLASSSRNKVCNWSNVRAVFSA